MFKHHIKYTIRHLKSNQLVFFGSIASIFLSVLCISLLFTYIHNELSMDNFHKREKDIYLLTVQQSPESHIEAIDAESTFKFNYKKYPGIENLTTIKKYRKGELQFVYDQSILSSEGIVVDSTFFDFFDFKLKIGNKTTVLHDPDAIVLTEKFARRLFGEEDPLGKVIKVTSRREKFYTVEALADPPPSNSSITFDFIIPDLTGGYSRSGGNFILVNEAFDKTNFIPKIKDLGHQHIQFKDSRMDIIALDDIYFNNSGTEFKGIFSKFGNRKNINILFVIIGVIFVITLLNFSNLQIISINSSIKNIGINKISGGGEKHILSQKVTELFILIFLSAILITLSFFIVVPYFNKITGVILSLKIWQIFALNFVVLFLLIVAAMIYPSIVYFRISITNSLKNQIFSGNKLAGRNIVATVQFTLSLVLLIASIVVVKQLHLMLTRDLGFTSENVICTKIFHSTIFSGSQEERMEQYKRAEKNYQYVKNELAASSTIKNFTQGNSPVSTFSMPWKLLNGSKDYANGNGLSVTPQYAELLGLKVVEGRFFEKERDKSRGNQVVINEAAKKFWGIEDISKARMLNKYWSLGEGSEGYEIIGVIKDFNSEHLSVKPQPLYMVYFDDMDASFLIQFEDGASQAGIQFVQKLFNEVNEGETFDYSFLSADIEAMYRKEKQLSKIYILFTIIAYSISAIGLFAISLYDTRRRTKEIGVRKVNGAKISEVITLLNKDFVKWVAISFVIATPVAWYAMHKWLENFAYKTALSWWIFALAGLLALVIALFTVSMQSWRAATRNPVEVLRYE